MPLQKRWMGLAFSTMLSLAGMLWSALRYGPEVLTQEIVLVAGLVIATGVALVALGRRSQSRWPAAVVLICAAPIAQPMLRVGTLLSLAWVDARELAIGIVLAVGSIATVVTAFTILFAKRPSQAPDPVARAVAQGRSSE